MNLFTEVELLIMASIVGILLLVVIILSICEIISKRKEKNILLEEKLEELEKTDNSILENKSENSNLELEENNQLYDTLVNLNKVQNKTLSLDEISTYEEKKEIESQEVVIQEDEKVSEFFFEEITEIEPTIQGYSSDLNIKKIESEELVELDSKEKAQIELLKIEEQLQHEESLEDTITNLEIIEEENAIISYQELINTKEFNVVTCDDGDEPITINEVFKLFNESKDSEKVMELVDAIPLSEAYQGVFSSTPYLSPINGIETESLSEIQLENTANLEKLEKEIRKTNEFLNILNELKKNLE